MDVEDLSSRIVSYAAPVVLRLCCQLEDCSYIVNGGLHCWLRNIPTQKAYKNTHVLDPLHQPRGCWPSGHQH